MYNIISDITTDRMSFITINSSTSTLVSYFSISSTVLSSVTIHNTQGYCVLIILMYCNVECHCTCLCLRYLIKTA